MIEMICYKGRKESDGWGVKLIVVGLDLVCALGPATCAGSGDKVS
jgi:hypothetical protein